MCSSRVNAILGQAENQVYFSRDGGFSFGNCHRRMFVPRACWYHRLFEASPNWRFSFYLGTRPQGGYLLPQKQKRSALGQGFGESVGCDPRWMGEAPGYGGQSSAISTCILASGFDLLEVLVFWVWFFQGHQKELRSRILKLGHAKRA